VVDANRHSAILTSLNLLLASFRFTFKLDIEVIDVCEYKTLLPGERLFFQSFPFRFFKDEVT